MYLFIMIIYFIILKMFAKKLIIIKYYYFPNSFKMEKIKEKILWLIVSL